MQQARSTALALRRIRELGIGTSASGRYLGGQWAGAAGQSPPPKPPEDAPSKPSPDPETWRSQYSPFFRRLADSLPHPHRPTKEELLNVASGFFQRMRVRWKWWTIRGFRRFNADDLSAFFSWLLVGHTLWILIGTTSFFAVVLYTANSLSLQHYIARAISDYLTSATGVTVVFESAIVPKWKDSRISFSKVYVSRHSGGETLPPVRPEQGSAARRMMWDAGHHPAYHDDAHGPSDEDDESLNVAQPPPQETWTMFDLNIDSVDVTLSLWRWLDGKGLVKDATIKGVRGVVDRRGVRWDPDKPLNPADFRHPHRPGDFELENFEIEDLLVTIYQPGGFRPYNFSIFNADMKTLRKQWLFFDLLSAENITGQFDGSLYSLHKPQSIGRTHLSDAGKTAWKRMSRFRIDGVSIDHLQAAAGNTSPTSWITSGKFDAVVDFTFPRHPDEDVDILDAIFQGIGNLGAAVQGTADVDAERIPGQPRLTKPALQAPAPRDAPESENLHAQISRKLMVDIDLRFRDVKARVPIYSSDLSYVNNALVRPIVAFINANRTLIPIHCHVEMDIAEFDGSWTLWETGLLAVVSEKIYEALAYHVASQRANNKRLKNVSLWSLQLSAKGALSAIRNIVDAPLLAAH